MKAVPVIAIMFSVVLTCGAILGISSYYGSEDWTWIAQQVASFVLIFMTVGVAFYVLASWMGKR